jgi:hypothetical protein
MARNDSGSYPYTLFPILYPDSDKKRGLGYSIFDE